MVLHRAMRTPRLEKYANRATAVGRRPGDNAGTPPYIGIYYTPYILLRVSAVEAALAGGNYSHDYDRIYAGINCRGS